MDQITTIPIEKVKPVHGIKFEIGETEIKATKVSLIYSLTLITQALLIRTHFFLFLFVLFSIVFFFFVLRAGSGSRSISVPKIKEKKAKKSKLAKFCTKLTRRLGCSAAPQLDFSLNDEANAHVERAGLLPEEVRKLRHTFSMIDYDESGDVDAEEFLEFVDERRSPFTEHVFKAFDSDGSGEVDFNEFIGVCCTYCMYSKQELLRFTFDSFDDDDGGTLDEEEFMILCKAVNNMNPTFPGNFTTALQEFDTNGDGLIDFEEFEDLNRFYPLVLFPAFRLQDRIQKVTLGEKSCNYHCALYQL